MANGRTVLKHTRVYAGGYDLSGFTRTIGPLSVDFSGQASACLGDEVQGGLPGAPVIGIGTLNGVLDPVASGLHALLAAPGSSQVVAVPIGIQAAPAAGDPVFCGQFYCLGYQAAGDAGLVPVSVPFGEWDVSALVNYPQAWGRMLHAKSAETGANTGTGIDDLAQSVKGGYLLYQVFAGDGTATIKAQDASTNSDGSFADLSGATSGSIDCSSPKAGIIAIGTTATVKRYLRWQVALGTANTVTFALAFVRGLGLA